MTPEQLAQLPLLERGDILTKRVIQIIDLGEVARSIEPFLAPWTTTAIRESFFEVVFSRPGTDAKFYVSVEQRSAKLTVASAAWPVWKYLSGGSNRSTTIVPSHVKKEIPSIHVSAKRKPESIAAEIKRRFLPWFEEVYAACLEEADRRTKESLVAVLNWAKVNKAAGRVSIAHEYFYCGPGQSVRVEQRDGDEVAEVRVRAKSPDEVAVLIKALADHRERGKQEALHITPTKDTNK